MEWMVIVIAFVLLLYVIALVWTIFSDDKCERFLSAILLTMTTCVLFALLSSYENRDTPSAIDVYQGKTTIEITYRDSIPVDSVVVFKKTMKE